MIRTIKIWNVKKGLILLFCFQVFLAPLFSLPDLNKNIFGKDAIFQKGKEAFFKELRLQFGFHPLKYRLLPESISRIENSDAEIPFLYENLINIMYLKDSRDFRALIDHGSYESMAIFEERFIKLSKEAAAHFVNSLFQRNSCGASQFQKYSTDGKIRLDLVLSSFQEDRYSGKLNSECESPRVLASTLNKLWGFRISGFQEAHKIAKGKGIKVGVVDSGFSRKPGKNQLDRIDFDAGFGLIDRKQKPWSHEKISLVDRNGHGTISAELLMTAAPESEISIYKISSDSNNPHTYWPAMQTAQAIYKAVYDGMDFILVSAVFDVDFMFLKDSCQFAYENNVIIVCPSGNFSDENPAKPCRFPAHYNTTISVAGVIRNMQNQPVAWIQSGASHYTSVAAPACLIDSAGNTVLLSESGIYDNAWAAAFVCGQAALVSSKIPKTQKELKGQYFQRIYEIITHSANPHILGFENFNPRAGYGLIDAEESVTEGLQNYLGKMKQIEDNFKKRMSERAKSEE